MITDKISEKIKLKTQGILTGEELSQAEIYSLLNLATKLKQQRRAGKLISYLLGKHLALLFNKPSLRTRFSFTVAMRELGGDVIESISDTRKTEEPRDQARVLAGYCHAIMVRTHSDKDLVEMEAATTIPIINGLSDLHHPCQALSDLFTLQEIFQNLQGLQLSYIGDGNNVLHSLLLLAPMLGVNIHFSCPPERMPNADILATAKKRATQFGASIKSFITPQETVSNAHAIYTDVWASMGFEAQQQDHLFAGFQVNEELMERARTDAIFMHCLPMLRGKEVSESLPDKPCSVIFQQSENRLHMQKALLMSLI